MTEKTVEIKDVDIKRLRVPLVIEETCPDCGKVLARDFNQFPMYYPYVGDDQTPELWCEECRIYIYVPVIVKAILMTVDIGEAKVVKPEK